MGFETGFSIVYFSAFFALAAISFVVHRRCSPAQKKKWLPRLTLLNLVIIGSLLLVLPVAWGHWPFAILVAAFLVLIGFASIKFIRICDSCGRVAQPHYFFSAASFCAKCGSKLTPSHLFGSPSD